MRLRDQVTSIHARRCVSILCLMIALLFGCAGESFAHPLGNFSVNHFSRIEIEAARLRVRYVVDMAEIPTFQESQAIDANADGALSKEELDVYLERQVAQYAEGLLLTLDGARMPLQLSSKNISLRQGAGNLQTLRIECDFAAAIPAIEAGGAHRLRYEDKNYPERSGWREIVIQPSTGTSVFESTAYGSAVTDELKTYPEDMLAAPLDERVAELSLTRGAVPAGAAALQTRDGRPVVAPQRDRLAELISVAEVTPMVALLGLCIAAGLGALHAFSPGHGKAVVGAYLVGTRGTIRHAAFLGLTVTITHTIGVFALGLVTLFASQYIVPEKLFPILSFISGAIVLGIGFSLFVRRLRAALGGAPHAHVHEHHQHDHAHEHDAHSHEHDAHIHMHDHEHDHTHAHDEEGNPSFTHSHGGREHTHLPPGADGGKITFRSLLGLGISGGLLPCPSALVVMLSAISLGRVGYGMLLITAFSFGLAATLTGVGLAFIYAGRFLKRPLASSGRLMRVLPVASAFVIASLGLVICYQSLAQAGLDFKAALNAFSALSTEPAAGAGTFSMVSLLLFGFVLGLKHAVEADHLAAVSTIVTERKSLLSSSLVGGLWGVGHTVSLLIAGIAVLLLHIRIGERAALSLEFCVGLMLIALGAIALRKIMRGGKLHLHEHRHGGRLHAHPHLHDAEAEAVESHTHHGFGLSARPLLIGMLHGLAGSAALMLLVLSTISSPSVGLLYIAVFGVGSVGGMMLMSALVALPLRLTARRFTRANLWIRSLAGVFSICFGLFMVYEIGYVDGLFRY